MMTNTSEQVHTSAELICIVLTTEQERALETAGFGLDGLQDWVQRLVNIELKRIRNDSMRMHFWHQMKDQQCAPGCVWCAQVSLL